MRHLVRRCLFGVCVACWYAAFDVAAAERVNLLETRDGAGQAQPIRTPAEWRERVASIRTRMERVMGPLPAPTQEPLALEVVEETSLRHYVRQRVRFTTEPGDRLSGYLLLPHATRADLSEAPKFPALVCLPGSSAPGKDAPAGLTSQVGMQYAHELAERGFVCLVLDYPLLHTRDYKTDPYALGYVSATMKGIVNHRRGVDLLASLPFVDAQAIGVIGHSLGGHNALFLAVFDERVKAIVSSCGFNVFAKHAGGDVRAWSSRYYMPRIRTEFGDDPARIPFDFTEVLAALAPRAVFVNAPLHDAPDFEVSGVRDCIDAALPVYCELFQAGDKLQVRYPDAGHAFPAAERQAAYAFLDRELRPAKGTVALDQDLRGHWPLAGDARDRSSSGHHGEVRGGVVFTAVGPNGKPGTAAEFNGRDAYLEIGGTDALRSGMRDFSLALWMRHDDPDAPGDLVSQYNAGERNGYTLAIKTQAITTSLANARQLHFGVDANRAGEWEDCGRPGESLLAFALASFDGSLYAGTCEPDEGQCGRVYRYVGGQQWLDCGAPDDSNSITALATYRGALYAGTGKYRVGGSALPESPNATLGGRVFRYAGGQKWIDCGQVPQTEAIGGLIVFKDQLYASSLYKPAGFYRFDGQQGWVDCGTPDGKRVVALGVFQGAIYATSYDGGRVYRYDGERWTDLGNLGDNTQTYSFATYQGRWHVGTWPSGKVYRFEDLNRWSDVGRLGEELEVMGMLVHNGRLIAGTLPLAEVYQYELGAAWKKLTRLDHTPEVKYRRAWTMAEHDGRVFCSTLPSGKIYAWEAGQNALSAQPLTDGWHHVVAQRTGGQLQVYVDGERVAQSPVTNATPCDLSTMVGVKLGFGPNNFFHGALADVRYYARSLNRDEIRSLARRPE